MIWLVLVSDLYDIVESVRYLITIASVAFFNITNFWRVSLLRDTYTNEVFPIITFLSLPRSFNTLSISFLSGLVSKIILGFWLNLNI